MHMCMWCVSGRKVPCFAVAYLFDGCTFGGRGSPTAALSILLPPFSCCALSQQMSSTRHPLLHLYIDSGIFVSHWRQCPIPSRKLDSTKREPARATTHQPTRQDPAKLSVLNAVSGQLGRIGNTSRSASGRQSLYFQPLPSQGYNGRVARLDFQLRALCRTLVSTALTHCSKERKKRNTPPSSVPRHTVCAALAHWRVAG